MFHFGQCFFRSIVALRLFQLLLLILFYLHTSRAAVLLYVLHQLLLDLRNVFQQEGLRLGRTTTKRQAAEEHLEFYERWQLVQQSLVHQAQKLSDHGK